MTTYQSPRHSVSVAGVVVDHAGRALIIQRRDNGTWEPPGGILELDEAIEEGLRREVLEETGLHVEVERLTGVYKNLPRGIVALVFRCRPDHGSVGVGPETTEVRWTTESEIRRVVDEPYAIRVLDALSGDEPAVRVRSHDGVHVLGQR